MPSFAPSLRTLREIYVLAVIVISSSVFAHPGSPLVARGTLVASYPIRIVKGFMLIDVPTFDTIETMPFRSVRSYLIDIGASNEGSWLLDSSSTEAITDYKRVSFEAADSATVPLSLIPTEARESFRLLDSAFAGTIGYGWLRQYVNVFDFAAKRWYMYRSDNNPKFAARIDTAAIHIPYLDDAYITYCHCPFPTIWLEGEAPPLTPGRVHLSLADNQSYIFKNALDEKTAKIVAEKERADSLSGKHEFGGLEVASFKIGGANIAKANPRRIVAPLPPRFKDLNVTVIGTLSIDVLRKYDAFIIDPSRQKIILVK